jgi:hypothetical protein
MSLFLNEEKICFFGQQAPKRNTKAYANRTIPYSNANSGRFPYS